MAVNTTNRVSTAGTTLPATPNDDVQTKPAEEKAPKERIFDAAFAHMPQLDRTTGPTPALKLDPELIEDLTTRRSTENTRQKEARRTRAILDQTDREIEMAAEAARQNQSDLSTLLTQRSLASSARMRASVEARKAIEAGTTPLASSVVALPSLGATPSSALRNARVGMDTTRLEARLAEKLRDAMVG